MRYDSLAAAAASCSLLLAAVGAGASAFAFGPASNGLPSGSFRVAGRIRPRHEAATHVGLPSTLCRVSLCHVSLWAKHKVSDEEMEGRKDQLRIVLCTTKAEIDKLVRKNPSVLSRCDIMKSYGPKVALLQERLGISQKEAGKLCLRGDRLLSYKLETLESKIDWLQARLDADDTAQLLRVIKRTRGKILTLSEDKILEVQHWMAERVGLSDAKIAQMGRSSPQILSRKISTLDGKVNWVQTALSLSDEELSDLFGKHPSLFTLHIEKNPRPRLQFLQLTFELNDHGLRDLVTSQPSLFSRSEKAIKEKVKFYSELVGEKEAKRLVTKSSNLLVTASLEKRLKPRLSQIRNAGTKVVWTEQLIQRLARRSDDQWERYGLGEAPKGRRRSSE